MNIDKLREELTFDEGCINKIYLGLKCGNKIVKKYQTTFINELAL